jgi:hypothetical protein
MIVVIGEMIIIEADIVALHKVGSIKNDLIVTLVLHTIMRSIEHNEENFVGTHEAVGHQEEGKNVKVLRGMTETAHQQSVVPIVHPKLISMKFSILEKALFIVVLIVQMALICSVSFFFLFSRS